MIMGGRYTAAFFIMDFIKYLCDNFKNPDVF